MTENQFNLLPLAIAHLISKHSVKEISFGLSKGHWKPKQWEYPVRYHVNGAELWVTFQHSNTDLWKSWRDVTSVLSSHFCASFEFIDKAATIQPQYSLRPQGIFANGTYRKENIFYASLANEAVCTENLTPWKKLLPCFGKVGLASVLNSAYIFNSNYFALSLDIKSICQVRLQVLLK